MSASQAPLAVLYEDKNIIVCIKPVGVSSEDTPAGEKTASGQPSAGAPAAKSGAALADASAVQRAVVGESVPAAKSGAPAKGGPACLPALLRARWGRADAYVGVVHRLDTAAAGVMVYAKNKAAAAALSAQVQSGALHKEYRCVCAGVPAPQCGEMRDFLFKDSRKNKVFAVKTARKGAKEARLDYTVLAVRPGGAAAPQADTAPGGAAGGGTHPTGAATGETNFALCAVRLHTGRTHQIRVQFASRRHPLCGDGKYGSREKGALALWCARLAFTLPGEKTPRTFVCFPPAAGAFALFPHDGSVL